MTVNRSLVVYWLGVLFFLTSQSCVSPEGKAYREKEEKWKRPMEVILKCEAIQLKARNIDSNEIKYTIDSMIVNRRKLYDRSIVTDDLKKIYAFNNGDRYVKFREVILVHPERLIVDYYLNESDKLFYIHNIRTYHSDSLNYNNFHSSQYIRKERPTEVYFGQGVCFDHFDSGPNFGYHSEDFINAMTKENNVLVNEFRAYCDKKNN